MYRVLQLFNQVNARKIYGEEDVMQGVLSNKLFVYILTAELALQVCISKPCQFIQIQSFSVRLEEHTFIPLKCTRHKQSANADKRDIWTCNP